MKHCSRMKAHLNGEPYVPDFTGVRAYDAMVEAGLAPPPHCEPVYHELIEVKPMEMPKTSILDLEHPLEKDDGTPTR